MSDSVTVVTGARKGIGRFLAEHYTRLGHRVIGLSRSTSDFVADAYEHIELDVADEAAVVKTFASIRRNHKKIDHLLNVAGVAGMNHVLLTPGSALKSMFETNVFGTFFCSREAAKVMQKAKWGRIVNFSTVAVPLRLEGEAAYVASKAAVVALSQVMARELAPRGITVNVVGPTVTDTDLVRNVPADRLESLLNRQAIPERGSMEDIAATIDYLLSDSARHITGQTLYFGGP